MHGPEHCFVRPLRQVAAFRPPSLNSALRAVKSIMNGDNDHLTIPGYDTSSRGGPEAVGAELRAFRERLGWKLPDIAARLKIRRVFLEAIESGNLAALPAPTYAAGFIRSYAEIMGLDPEEILRRFRAEGMSRTRLPALSFPEPLPDRAVPPGAVLFLVAAIGLGGYFLWYRHSEHELRMARMVPEVPAKLAPLAIPKSPQPKPVTGHSRTAASAAQPAATPPAAPAPTGVSPGAAPQIQASQPASPQAASSAVTAANNTAATNTAAAPVSAATVSSAANASAGAGAAGSAASPAASADTAVPGASAASARVTPNQATGTTSAGAQPAGLASATAPGTTATTPTGSASSPAGSNPLVISASADSWVQVRGPHGTILFSRVLKAGQSWPVPNEPGLTMTTGNAGGTVLVRNGTAGAPLGKPGTVLHNVPLTPAAPAGGASAPAATPAAQ
ncbi:unnamed protein product [Acidocella sp. C78]|uniref:helix-turn-helix domain-containing protein n=1 Tax=Acidocella sp. C78 TaxID=1671486 RepID=UPI001BC1C557|nr:helix-turn-helix domain-containing protein [Acidocella sp. C78]CAG4923549.1 unnamed protein product [Acidocella sp. C78]